MNVNTIVETSESYVIIKELEIYKIRLITEVFIHDSNMGKEGR